MPKYLVTATKTIEYQIPVEAEDESAAYESLNEWITDDFEPYEQFAEWDFEVEVDE